MRPMAWTCSTCKQTYTYLEPNEHVCSAIVGDDILTTELFNIIRQIDAVLAQNEKLLRALLQTQQ